MGEKLIKDLCTYLGELDYIIENSKDVLERSEYERKREAVHVILDLPYKVKGNNFMSLVISVLNLEYTMENNLALQLC